MDHLFQPPTPEKKSNGMTLRSKRKYFPALGDASGELPLKRRKIEHYPDICEHTFQPINTTECIPSNSPEPEPCSCDTPPQGDTNASSPLLTPEAKNLSTRVRETTPEPEKKTYTWISNPLFSEQTRLTLEESSQIFNKVGDRVGKYNRIVFGMFDGNHIIPVDRFIGGLIQSVVGRTAIFIFDSMAVRRRLKPVKGTTSWTEAIHSRCENPEFVDVFVLESRLPLPRGTRERANEKERAYLAGVEGFYDSFLEMIKSAIVKKINVLFLDSTVFMNIDAVKYICTRFPRKPSRLIEYKYLKCSLVDPFIFIGNDY